MKEVRIKLYEYSGYPVILYIDKKDKYIDSDNIIDILNKQFGLDLKTVVTLKNNYIETVETREGIDVNYNEVFSKENITTFLNGLIDATVERAATIADKLKKLLQYVTSLFDGVPMGDLITPMPETPVLKEKEEELLEATENIIDEETEKMIEEELMEPDVIEPVRNTDLTALSLNELKEMETVYREKMRIIQEQLSCIEIEGKTKFMRDIAKWSIGDEFEFTHTDHTKEIFVLKDIIIDCRAIHFEFEPPLFDCEVSIDELRRVEK
jgi:hypothetical protein